MKSSDGLFKLIHSLSKTEKWYFKKFSKLHVKGEQNNYLILFDIINELKVYDEKKVQDLLKQKNIQRLRERKSYLYQQILKSLESLYADSRVDIQARRQLNFINILQDKHLLKKAYELINKLKKHCLRYELFPSLLDVLNQESIIMQLLNIKDEKGYLELESTYAETLSKLEVIEKYRQLLRKTNRTIWMAGKEYADQQKNELKEILAHPYLVSNKHANSFSSFVIRENVLTLIYQINGSHAKLHQTALKYVALFEEHPQFITGQPIWYAYALFRLLAAYFFIKDYKGFDACKKKILAHIDTLTKSSYALEATKIKVMTYEAYWEICISEGLFEKGLLDIRLFQKADIVLQTKTMQIEFWQTVAILYFGVEDYQGALDMINQMLNFDDKKHMVGSMSFARVLSLLSHYELNNYLLVESLSNIYLRKMSSGKQSFVIEVLIANFLKKLINANSTKKKKELLQSMKSELLIKFSQSNEARAYRKLDIIAWIDSKLEGKEFEQIVKRKIKL